jgi:hypothetical protein
MLLQMSKSYLTQQHDPRESNFQRMKKIEDQAINAVPRVYSIHRCRISPQIASNPAMQ